LLKILRKLVFEAQVRGMRFGELVGTLITAAMEGTFFGERRI
jgi:hypothetical protein